jgi:hypothetical protein
LRANLLLLRSILLTLPLLAACSGNSRPGPGDDLLFQDEFVPGQTGAWLLEADDAARSVVVDGQLQIGIDAPQIIHYATLAEPAFADFALEVDVTQVSGDLQSSADILFRMQGPAEFYRFGITGNGLWIAEKHNPGGSWSRFLDDWTESAAITQGHLATNRLRIVADGSTLSFYANATLLSQLSDAAYPSGKIALAAGTFGRPGLIVNFDNLVVTEP